MKNKNFLCKENSMCKGPVGRQVGIQTGGGSMQGPCGRAQGPRERAALGRALD